MFPDSLFAGRSEWTKSRSSRLWPQRNDGFPFTWRACVSQIFPSFPNMEDGVCFSYKTGVLSKSFWTLQMNPKSIIYFSLQKNLNIKWVLKRRICHFDTVERMTGKMMWCYFKIVVERRELAVVLLVSLEQGNKDLRGLKSVFLHFLKSFQQKINTSTTFFFFSSACREIMANYRQQSKAWAMAPHEMVVAAFTPKIYFQIQKVYSLPLL